MSLEIKTTLDIKDLPCRRIHIIKKWVSTESLIARLEELNNDFEKQCSFDLDRTPLLNLIKDLRGKNDTRN